MPRKRLNTEEKVLKVIGAPDFKNLNDEHLAKFSSNLPYMSDDVAIRCIEQFPEFSNCANNIMKHLVGSCDSIIKDNKDSADKAIESYKAILETNRRYLETHKFILPGKRNKIMNQMIEIADRIAEIHDKKMQNNKDMFGVLAAIGGFALTIGGALLGIKIFTKD